MNSSSSASPASIARSSGSKSLPFTSASKQKASESGSMLAMAPIRTPTLVGRAGRRGADSLRTASRIAAATPISCTSADPRQLISGQCVDDAGRPERSAQSYQAGLTGRDGADYGSLAAERMAAHCGNYFAGILGGYNRH